MLIASTRLRVAARCLPRQQIISLHASHRASNPDVVPHDEPLFPRYVPLAFHRDRQQGSIDAVFPSLSGEPTAELPERFAELKRALVNGETRRRQVRQMWTDVLARVKEDVKEVVEKGNQIIPQIRFSELAPTTSSPFGSLSDSAKAEIKRRGSVIIRGVVDPEVALRWKEDVREYVRKNPEVKGFPANDPQVYELYWSTAQLAARAHPNVLHAHRWALSQLWHSSDPLSEVSLGTPISYADRVRIRTPGDAVFALGPHIDGGSLERWEDPGFRACFSSIFQEAWAGSADGLDELKPDVWTRHDPWDATPRLTAQVDLYGGAGACSMFRPLQGWLSMSSTGPGEGTLRLLPFLVSSTAYLLLRPFFRPLQPLLSPSSPSARSDFLADSNWVLDLDSTSFPGSNPGCSQELSDETHPHLELGKSMVSVPKVEPGDEVLWHCDTVHAVEPHHNGKGDSSVIYVAPIPLTIHNADYLGRQRDGFFSGRPGPDFPGGEGESGFVGRGRHMDVKGQDGRRAMGLEKFVVTGAEGKMMEGEKRVVEAANKMLFGSS